MKQAACTVVAAVSLIFCQYNRENKLFQAPEEYARVVKSFSKWRGTSARQKTIENFCGLNW